MGICLIVKSGGGTDTSNANVTADKILSGYTVYSNDNKITGTMFNVANQCKTDATWGNSSGTYTFVPGTVGGVWGGYHDGTCVMQAATLASQTDCDIPNQWWCLTGYSYWAKGIKYDGAMAVRGTKTWSIGANGTQTIEEGWHDGNGYVNQSIPVDTGEWGPTPTTTNQQLCWPGWYYSANRWCWGSGNLVPWNIKNGVSIFGVNGTWSGWVDNTIGWNSIGAPTATLNLGEYTVSGESWTPSGYPFRLEFWQDTWQKLINQGFNYVCWNCTANAYKNSKWRYSVDARCSFMLNSSTQQDLSLMGIWWDIGHQQWISSLNVSNQFYKDLPITGLGGVNTGGYGSDVSTSGKYSIKTPGDHVISKGETWFKITMGFYPHGSSDDDGFSAGKVNFKALNVWFSKS